MRPLRPVILKKGPIVLFYEGGRSWGRCRGPALCHALRSPGFALDPGKGGFLGWLTRISPKVGVNTETAGTFRADLLLKGRVKEGREPAKVPIGFTTKHPNPFATHPLGS